MFILSIPFQNSGHNFLLQHNRGNTLPANVMQTLEDWRGGMKRVRIRMVPVVESEDPLVMADLTHRKKFVKYLRPLDPRLVVEYGDTDEKELSRLLEKEGFIVD